MTDRLLTYAEAAEQLAVGERWLRDAVTNRKVPFTRVGRHVRFTQAQVDDIVRAGEVRPRDEADPLAQRRRRRQVASS